MKLCAALTVAVAALGLCACTVKPLAVSAVPYTMHIGGDGYVIYQLTASTWTATAPGAMQPLASGAASKTELLDAIEKTSGCKVTDSDFSRQGMQLDAQVNCADRLKD